MFSGDKITEIFCICDDFCREFDVELQKGYEATPNTEVVANVKRKSQNRK